MAGGGGVDGGDELGVGVGWLAWTAADGRGGWDGVWRGCCGIRWALAVGGLVEELAGAGRPIREGALLYGAGGDGGGEDLGDFLRFAIEIGGDVFGGAPVGWEGVGALGEGFPGGHSKIGAVMVRPRFLSKRK